MGESSSHYTITPRVLAGVKQREDAIVALIEEGADPDVVCIEYRKLRSYLFHHVFPKRWIGRTSDPLAIAEVVRHHWAARVDTIIGSSYCSGSGSTGLSPKEVIAYLRNTYLILQNAAQLTNDCVLDELDDLFNSRGAYLHNSIGELIHRAVKIANPANTHCIIVTGHGALESLNSRVDDAENKFRNFSAILELLTNAVKYSPAGSTITLHFKQTVTRSLYGYLKRYKKGKGWERIRSPDGEFYRIDYFFATVTDEGIGIPTDEIQLVAQKGYRASNTVGIHGTGFGLSGIDLGGIGSASNVKISSPPQGREVCDPEFPGTAVRICLAH